MHTHIVQRQRNSFQRDMIIYAGAAMIESKKKKAIRNRKQSEETRGVCMCVWGVCVWGVSVKGLNS